MNLNRMRRQTRLLDSPVFWRRFSILFLALAVLCAVFPSVRFGLLFFGALGAGGGILSVAAKRAQIPGKQRNFWKFIGRLGKILFLLWLASFIIVEGLILYGCISDPIPPETDFILVLGAGLRGENPSATLASRIRVAEEYLRCYPEAKAVLCGGQGEDEIISEAACMYRVMTEDGISPDRLILEDASRNTVQNIKNAKTILDELSGGAYQTAFVTSSYHLFRGRILMEHAGLDPVGAGARTPYAAVEAMGTIREYFSLLKYLFA